MLDRIGRGSAEGSFRGSRCHLFNSDPGDSMLAKCANPDCSAVFRYLHEGKVYMVDSKAAFAGSGRTNNAKIAGALYKCEYYWLCASCCRELTIQIDGDHRVRVALRREHENIFQSEISPADSGLASDHSIQP
jgi:hypothetical protein